MSRIHAHNDPDRFRALQHLVFALHDSTFECICRAFDIQTAHGSISDFIPVMLELLFEKRKKL